jgi:hypothetical protein
MYDNWAEVRQQMEQVLERERVQRQARRRRQQPFWQALRQWGVDAIRFVRGARWSPATIAFSLTSRR